MDLYADDDRAKKLATFYFLRQQMPRGAEQLNHCLADYVAPANGGHGPPLQDYLGGFAVFRSRRRRTGGGIRTGRDHYSAIMTKALADRLAEALAEFLHKRTRIAWGFGRDEQLSQAELIREKYSDGC